MTTVPVFHCFDHNYVLPAAVCFQSLLEHAVRSETHYALYVVGRDLTDADREQLQGVVARFPQATLTFLPAPDLGAFGALVEGGRNWNTALSVDLFFKLSVPDLLPDQDIVVVADVDVVYADDIALTFDELKPTDEAYVAGGRDLAYAGWRGEGLYPARRRKMKRYFRQYTAEERARQVLGAGLMVFNCRRLRADGIPARWRAWAEANVGRLILPEQDIINQVCFPHLKPLPWNHMCVAPAYGEYVRMGAAARSANPVWDAMFQHPVQVHYASSRKPWRDRLAPLARLWFDAWRRAGVPACSPQETHPVVLFWGRHDANYSRNGVVRKAFRELGWEVRDFRPHISACGDLEAWVRQVAKPSLVWVPCFRQRDVAAAARWARRKGVPIVFDPLISAWDKQVLEFAKLPRESAAARRLLAKERRQFAGTDLVIADTAEHARFFTETLGVASEKIRVVYVGADEEVFHPVPLEKRKGTLEVLFYGSMLPLQGPDVIVAAARLTQGEPIHWTLLGSGPELARCQADAAGLTNVSFVSKVPYAELLDRMQAADVLLGVFGTTAKAARVMPNKFFQALAAGRPVITRTSDAYPDAVRQSAAVVLVPPGDAAALATAVRKFESEPGRVAAGAAAAYPLYEAAFGPSVVRGQLEDALERVLGVAPVDAVAERSH